MMRQTKTLSFGLLWALLLCLPRGGSHAAELTERQRKTADALVAKRIRAVRSRIVADCDLERNIKKLSRRKKEWGGWQPAMRIGFCVKKCRESHVPAPKLIGVRIVDDIIWQYENAYGAGNDLKYHREECARALGFIGHPKGVPTILKSLAQEGGHFSWQALEGVTDERFIAAIEENLDFTCQQDAFPAIECLAEIGPASIPTIRHFLGGDDGALKREAVSALVKIGAPECAPILQELIKDRELAVKAKVGLLRIRCRAVDRIYSPACWKPEDESRLHYLTNLALFDEDRNARLQAAKALLKLGESGVWHLRQQLPNYSHIDGPEGPFFFISERSSDLLTQIGEPAVPALIDALCDEHEHSRRFAGQALRRITSETFDSHYEDWKNWYLQRQQGKSTQPSIPADAE